MIFVNDPKVFRYISCFPDLISVIEPVIEIIEEEIPGSQVILKVYQDSEINDEYLMFIIRNDKRTADSSSKLANIHLKTVPFLNMTRGYFQVSFDF